MSDTKSEKPSRSSGTLDRWVLVGALLLGLAVTAVCTRLAWVDRDAVLQRGLRDAAHEIATHLARQAGGVEAFVETVAAFLESSAEVKRTEFDSFVGRTAGLWPGMVAVEWQAWVPGDRLGDFEAQMQADQPGFRVVERDALGNLVRATPKQVHLPVVHVFNTGGVTAQPGLDLAASREWFESKLAAMGAERAVASPSFGIVAADGRGLGEGFSVSDSVLASGTGPARERLRGFVSAVFAYRPMIDAAVAGSRIKQLRVTVRDSGDASPFYFSWAVGDGGDVTVTAMELKSTIDVAGRTWEIAVAPTPALFGGMVMGMPWFVLGAGLLVTSACLGVLVWRQRVHSERDARAVDRLETERRFRDIVDLMSGAVIVVRADAEGAGFELVELNGAAAELVGCARELAPGRRLTAVIPGARDSGLLAAIERVRVSGETQRLETVGLVQRGQVRHIDGIIFPVRQGGEICAVLHDLTELKAAERALREARDELELALDVSRVGLWSWDMANKRLRLDIRCARLYGLSAAEVVDDSEVTSRIHPEDLKVIREEVDRAVREGRSYEVEFRFTLPDGSLRHLCTRARPVREASVTKIVGCSWDVTDRRRMEEHLRRTQRLESLGTLAGGVAHDLNNALAPVTMGLDLLKRRLGADAEAVESVKLMQTSVRRASSIVRQLIAFKRGAGETKQAAPAHPKRILEVLGTTLVESFSKDISVLIEPASLDLPRIVADEREAHQVLLNLCVNARDAMPQGGKLVVSCEPLEVGGTNQGQFPELRPGSYVLFSVADTGVGISSDIRHRVFDPFFTTKDVGKGSGLGLSTALGIVKAHRGGIQFETREGIGTTFRVVFPTLPDDEPSRTVAIAAAAPASGDPVRLPCLLLVDDEVQVRELARRALEQSGYKVMTAGNGREAVELFTQHVQAIDAVIMDLLMPVMNGAAATAAIKRLRPDVPIVGASGFATDALVDEARNAGISTFLPKPFTVAVLVDAVRSAMGQKPG